MGNASLMAFTRAVGSKSVDHGVRWWRSIRRPPAPTACSRCPGGQAEQKFGDPERWPGAHQAYAKPGRAAEPDEVADLTVFLASDRASYISGVVMTLDGGVAVARH